MPRQRPDNIMHVSLDRSLRALLAPYASRDVPRGLLGRVLLDWGLAVMAEAPTLPLEEARAFFAVARETRLRPWDDGDGLPGASRVARELDLFPTAVVEESVAVGFDRETVERLLARWHQLTPLAQLGLLLRLALASELVDRLAVSRDTALAAAGLVEP